MLNQIRPIKILETGIKQNISPFNKKSDYFIKIKSYKPKISLKLINSIKQNWEFFTKEQPFLAKNDKILYSYNFNKKNNVDYTYLENYSIAHAFCRTKMFENYFIYVNKKRLNPLSSHCLILTKDNKLVFGIKVNMNNKISGFSGYAKKEDIKNNLLDIYSYLCKQLYQELFITKNEIIYIKRIGKTYTPNILDNKNRLNIRGFDNNFILKLKVSSAELKKRFNGSFQFKKDL